MRPPTKAVLLWICLDADVGALFVSLHQATVGSYVTDYDGGETTRPDAV
jgi:hypothetical protein